MKQLYMEKDVEKYVMAHKDRHEYKQFQDLFLVDIIGYGMYEQMKDSLFSEFWFSNITIYQLPISQMIGGGFLLLASFAFIMQTSVDETFIFSLFFTLAFFLLGAGLIYSGIQSFKRIAVYKKTLHYLDAKDSIIQERERLEMSIKDDIDRSGIDVVILDDIKRFISLILTGYETIKSSHEYIQNHRGYFGAVSQEGQAVINREFQWIIDYSLEFTTLVQSWISHHAIELTELEQQIQSQAIATENTGGKLALDLSRISLQENLNRLEKICV